MRPNTLRLPLAAVNFDMKKALGSISRSPNAIQCGSAFAILWMLATEVVAEDFAKWRYYRAIQLNTSATGATVSGDVRNFPVAVALSADNFDFNQAKADGADLRFSVEQNGATLPYHIESWVRTNQSALVWVKVPVVRGNSADQKIFMHWGNEAMNDAGDSKAVFDTKDGFVAAWHLADEGSMEDGGYKDATANAAHGTGVNMARSSRVDARVGRGALFRYSANQWIRIGGTKRTTFDITNQLTFSIWAKAYSYGNKGDPATRALPGYETMFAKGDNSWRLQKFGIRSWHKPPAELIEICVEPPPRADLCVVGRTDMVTNHWFHFVGVHDHAVGIGNQSQFPDKGRSWDGVLDEARVLNVVKDEHWIKLDYESQREGQKFLIFGKIENRF